jgi:hypothetical protein
MLHSESSGEEVIFLGFTSTTAYNDSEANGPISLQKIDV